VISDLVKANPLLRRECAVIGVLADNAIEHAASLFGTIHTRFANTNLFNNYNVIVSASMILTRYSFN
jgi:hypothetical protein